MTLPVEMNPSERAEVIEALLPFEDLADAYSALPDGFVVAAMGDAKRKWEITVGDYRTLQAVYRKLCALNPQGQEGAE